MTTVHCYIEEYENDRGQRSARLRQKLTGRKVDLGFTDAQSRQDFLRFLSAAKQNEELMPGVFVKESDEDSIVVSGDIDFDAPDEIRFVPNDNLQYLFD